MKLRTVSQDYQAGESALKCLSQRYNRMALVGFEPRPCRLQSLCCRHFQFNRRVQPLIWRFHIFKHIKLKQNDFILG